MILNVTWKPFDLKYEKIIKFLHAKISAIKIVSLVENQHFRLQNRKTILKQLHLLIILALEKFLDIDGLTQHHHYLCPAKPYGHFSGFTSLDFSTVLTCWHAQTFWNAFFHWPLGYSPTWCLLTLPNSS